MLISVTAKDIRNSSAGLAYCPVALAIRRQVKEAAVLSDYVELLDSASTFDLPRSAQRFIARFDAGKPVKPFRFRIKMPKA